MMSNVLLLVSHLPVWPDTGLEPICGRRRDRSGREGHYSQVSKLTSFNEILLANRMP